MLPLMLHMRRTAMVRAAMAVLRCSACAAWRARSGRARRREAEAEAAAEPVLSSFLHAAVVAQPSLTAAVAWVLAHRLDDCSSSGLDPVRPRGAGVDAAAAASVRPERPRGPCWDAAPQPLRGPGATSGVDH